MTLEAAPALRIAGVSRAYGPIVAVDRLDLDVRAGELLALLGPSGCGKTTLLRLVAGLEAPDGGTIDIAGRRVAGPGGTVPPQRRRVGMVFQDLALFPHLSVAANVAYGIRHDPDRSIRVAELLDLVDLAGAGERMPHELSGGMRQRVAIARALAPRPDILLLDEPFSSLDAALRAQVRAEVREIVRAAGATTVLVTHDQDEALTLGDRVAVMSGGRIEQVDVPEVVYGEPASPLVAGFVGMANLVDATCRAGVGLTRLGPVRLLNRPAVDGHAVAVIRPEHLELEEAPDGGAGGSAWQITARRFAGSEILLEVRASDGYAVWSEAGPHVRRLRLGDRVTVRLREIETVAFPQSTLGAPVSTTEPTVQDDGDHPEGRDGTSASGEPVAGSIVEAWPPQS